MTSRPTELGLVMVILLTVILGIVMAADGTKEQYEMHKNTSEEWCSAENGTLHSYYDAVISSHNGLHCETGNETYHMWAVRKANYTHDRAELESVCPGMYTIPRLGCHRNEMLFLVVSTLAAAIGLIHLHARYAND